MKVALHITHEAVQKIGGIGSVIAGLITSSAYNDYFDRTILYGPLFNIEGNPSSRLGKDGVVLYSGLDDFDVEKYTHIFSPIEKKYGVGIVYGKRMIANETNPNNYTECETILIHINNMKPKLIDELKFILWESFGIRSEKFKDWDYEQYMRIAAPYAEIIKGLISKNDPVTHFSHEYMGIPSALRIIKERSKGRFAKHRTVFYAHEVSTARSITENMAGHDVSFYGIMRRKDRDRKSMEEVFGSRSHLYRNELVKRVEYFDSIFAVSSLIADEILFLNPSIDEEKIFVVYNGIFLKKTTPAAKKKSRNILKKYCKTLFNYTPDILMTHVTRLVSSKGLWRDISLLEELDKKFAKRSKTGFYILLSTLIGTGRPANEVARMEKEYGWPVLHKQGWPDLVGAESEIYDNIASFNARSKNIKAVFINQFGFNRHSTGIRTPENADWIDLRIGSDAEFGMSVYEPFGIAQIETIQFGGMAILSSSCGCSDLIDKKFRPIPESHQIIDFTKGAKDLSAEDLRNMDTSVRKEIEKRMIEKNSGKIFNKLINSDDSKEIEKRIKSAQKLAFEIDWEHTVQKNIIPAVKKIHS